jgi:hypothetical protein
MQDDYYQRAISDPTLQERAAKAKRSIEHQAKIDAANARRRDEAAARRTAVANGVKPEPTPVAAPGADGDCDLLAAMRHVASRPKKEDVTELQRSCRKWYDEDINRFMSKLADLTTADTRRKGVGVSPPDKDEDDTPEPDEGVARAQAAIARFRREVIEPQQRAERTALKTAAKRSR